VSWGQGSPLACGATALTPSPSPDARERGAGPSERSVHQGTTPKEG
jgi:hypothetical protein